MTDTTKTVQITPDTKVSTLLDQYPQLEDVLIDLAPAFSKLKNPVLRRTIARITSLRQVAAIGEISISDLINKLRQEAGINEIYCEGEEESVADAGAPDWFSPEKISRTLDARPLIEAGEHPVGQVLQEVQNLQPGEIYELITPFLPAPLIDKVKEMGFLAWSKSEKPDLIRSFFTRK